MAIYHSYGRPTWVTAAEIVTNSATFGTTCLSCIQFYNPYTAPGSDPSPKRFLLKRLQWICRGGITIGRLTNGRPGGGTSTLSNGGAIESSLGAADGRFPWSAFGSNIVGSDYGIPLSTNENKPVGEGGVAAGTKIEIRRYAYSSNAYPEHAQEYTIQGDFGDIPAVLPPGPGDRSFNIVTHRPGFHLQIRGKDENAALWVSALWSIEDYGPDYSNVETGDP